MDHPYHLRTTARRRRRMFFPSFLILVQLMALALFPASNAFLSQQPSTISFFSSSHDPSYKRSIQILSAVSESTSPSSSFDDSDNHINPPIQSQSEQLPRSIQSLASKLEALSVEELQQYLVQRGIQWKNAPPSVGTRVPGCVATVYILLQSSERSNDDDNDTAFQLTGSADAILSRGLVSLVNELIQNLSSEELLSLDPNRIATQLHLQKALSPGRNNGLANMIQVVQAQLKLQLEGGGQEVVQHADDQQAEAEKSTSKSSLPRIVSPDPDSTSGRPTVALLLSGGVDSSVALNLLLQQGYDVTPVYLKIWLEDELSHLGECPWEQDVEMCRQVCDQAGLELQTLSLQEEYHARVMQHTLNEAQAGRTPNPDILCNSRIKFGTFLDCIQGFDYVASGHYAQVDHSASGVSRLYRAPDPVKDQSYFLCALTQEQLSRVLFPTGHLEKAQVRQLAQDFHLPNRNRPDSQGLCFLGKLKFRDFIEEQLGCHEGSIVDCSNGDEIGRHSGVWFHTVGQRKGLGPSLFPLATSQGPWYVVAKDPSKNIVYASNQYDEETFTKARSEFHVEEIHWITGQAPDDSKTGDLLDLEVKIRHGPRLVNATVELLDKDEAYIRLEAKDGGLAPGQYVVFYTQDKECLGGGIISERHWGQLVTGLSVLEESLPTSTNETATAPV